MGTFKNLFIFALGLGVGAIALAATQNQRQRGPQPEAQLKPAAPKQEKDCVDRSSEDSFPASDPPSWNAPTDLH